MNTVIGIFNDSKAAGEAVADLKAKGYTNDISLIAKNDHGTDVSSHQVKQETGDGTSAGAAMGGVIGALTGLLVGATSFIVPGVGLVVLGPLAATLSGAAAGAVAGGLVGALVDAGIPEERAKAYQDAVKSGQVLVSVTTDEGKADNVMEIMRTQGASEAMAYRRVE